MRFDSNKPILERKEKAMPTNVRNEALIRIVDDDPEIRESLGMMLESEGWRQTDYDSAESFLAGDTPSVPGVVLIDIQMDGMNGLDLQILMTERGYALPVIFVTGHGNVRIAVDSMRNGAYDFLEKPVDIDRLLASLEGAAALSVARSSKLPDESVISSALEKLTERQVEVLRHLLNREEARAISERLGISMRTVQGHRVKIYQAFGIHRFEQLCAVKDDVLQAMNAP